MAEKIYYLGVDGGGTKTTAVVFDGNGNFICKTLPGAAGFYDLPVLLCPVPGTGGRVDDKQMLHRRHSHQ